MKIDCHVHVSACVPGHGCMSRRLEKSLPFAFMRWRLGLKGSDAATETQLEAVLARTLEETDHLDAAAVLAFDAVHTGAGEIDLGNTHLYVTNDYVIELAQRQPRMLFGASVHPYRKDAVQEVERCAAAGAVLLKWLPIVQNFNPADQRCLPFYEALAHHKLPLLSHTGGEQCLPNLDKTVASPALLEEALKRGVTVIMAHCGTPATFREPSYVSEFMRLARTYEHCYGDTSALNLPARWGAYRQILGDPLVRNKLVHGSDWPVIALPPPHLVGLAGSLKTMCEPNWMKRDVLIKQRLDFDEDYWQRAGQILRLPEKTPA